MVPGTMSSWPGLRLERRIEEGNRNEVWEGTLDGERVSVRSSRRSAASLDWELELIHRLDGEGLVVPTPTGTRDGSWSCDGVVVQKWIDGRPPDSAHDWAQVAEELRRLHRESVAIGQRPGCCGVTELGRFTTSVDADMSALPDDVAAQILGLFAAMSDAPVSLIHGNPTWSNLRITDSGRVGLLDWDESRIDISWHDLSNLGVRVLAPDVHRCAARLSDVWEVANAWVVEPDDARRRLATLADASDELR